MWQLQPQMSQIFLRKSSDDFRISLHVWRFISLSCRLNCFSRLQHFVAVEIKRLAMQLEIHISMSHVRTESERRFENNWITVLLSVIERETQWLATIYARHYLVLIALAIGPLWFFWIVCASASRLSLQFAVICTVFVLTHLSICTWRKEKYSMVMLLLFVT